MEKLQAAERPRLERVVRPGCTWAPERGGAAEPVTEEPSAPAALRHADFELRGRDLYCVRESHVEPGEARNEIARLQADQDFIRSYQDRTHPDHADAVARMSGLYQQAYPGGDGGV